MCGIIGYIGNKNAIKSVISGLEHLEYRGYDSAGIAYFDGKKIQIVKETGRVSNLKNKVNFDSNICIGHTRWATHGKVTKTNSHPHKVGSITIVHNGIIENYLTLKKELSKEGYKFLSTTDTEVACALLESLYNKTNDLTETIRIFIEKVVGSYAIALISDNEPNYLYAIKKDSPLIIGLGDNENYIASDVPAILDNTNKYINLEDFEFAKISNNDITLYDKDGNIKEYKINIFNGDKNLLNKNGFEHYMLKEINEQPQIIQDIFKNFNKTLDLKKYSKIDIVACGSAYNAGLVGKTLIEEYFDIPVNIELASEYRYKKLFIDNNTLVIIISQSGETADSLAALKIAKTFGAFTLGIVNVKESSIARLADDVIYTEAGCEIAVATTKAYSAQIAIFIKLIINTLNIDIKNNINVLINEMLNKINNYIEVAEKIHKSNNVFYIGRGIDYALSMEGALKLKEISYINAQGYAAGELKHGTISLIKKNTPVIALITNKLLADKTISNIKEVKSRGAYVILIISENIKVDKEVYNYIIKIPSSNNIVSSLLSIIPLQLIAYETAKKLNCDIDKPKNLAKSVTVE